MDDKPRLIEHAFPLKQASLTSVHEKNVRHGHISTLHIWPARRPLAACRAALLATLLPDPGTPEARRELCERIGGKVVEKIEKKKMPNGKTVDRVKEEVVGGVLNWIGTAPTSGSKKKKDEHKAIVEFRENELAWFREQIRKEYGGRAPRVLDPFAGGGAIPLEAMRLGCEATAVDINPVAWFILKCTLEYPQKLAGKTHPLPEFILEDEEFMNDFYKAHPHLIGKTKRTKKQQKEAQNHLFDSLKDDSGRIPKADLAWHVRAWGRWVLSRARKELAEFYPTYADFEPRDLKNPKPYERQEMKLVPIAVDGVAEIGALNAEFSEEYLANKKNPRWVAKPTVAYMWARTVRCKNCRAKIPLLKTLWLSRKPIERVMLTLTPNERGDGVDLGVTNRVPVVGGNAAQRREHDKRISSGTMSRAGAKCPCCETIATMQDIRLEGQAKQIGEVLTAVVVNCRSGKEYRLPTPLERGIEKSTKERFVKSYDDVPFGIPNEETPRGGGRGAGRVFAVHSYGLRQWADLFTNRQHLALSTFVRATRRAKNHFAELYSNASWREGIYAGLVIGVDRICDRQSTVCRWDNGYTKLQGTFTRFALPITWDYCEGNPFSDATGNYIANLEWVSEFWEHSSDTCFSNAPAATILRQSATAIEESGFDCVITDPPYYDAIPYSDLMDFFYIWLRRTLHGMGEAFDEVFSALQSPKWDSDVNDGELIDDESRQGGDSKKSKLLYEDGMARAFSACHRALRSEGRLVVVFAHKHPDAWETLVSAIIRSGFVVDGSWPIQTEMGNRTRALSGAALASSVWLVCRKRPETARSGWDNRVLDDMRLNIKVRLREYWDAGIRGPDFVWAATGPALEAYSKHPIVKKANDPGQVMAVGEFLSHVRRMVVDFVVGQVLSGEQDEADLAAADRMDAPTAYYLLHRHDFGMDEAPAGACILYSTACGISDRDLSTTWNLVAQKGSSAASSDADGDYTETGEDADADFGSDSGNKIKLKTWAQRNNLSMGYEAPSGRPIPLIDRVHRMMHLWKAGDVHKVDEYLDENGLRRQELFKRLLQSLIELSSAGGDERKLLESLSNHIHGKGAIPEDLQATLAFNEDE